MMKGDKVLNRPIVNKKTHTHKTQNKVKHLAKPKKSNNYEQLMNIKRQLTLVEHTHTKMKRKKRKERERANQTVKKSKTK